MHKGLEPCKIYINNDPGLTLTYFTARSNLVPKMFEWEKGKTVHLVKTIGFFLLNESRSYMNPYE